MKKTRTYLSLARIALVITIIFTSNVRTSGKASTKVRDRCTTVIVGKGATADGSVLLGHNEDWGMYEIPLRWSQRETHKRGETVKLSDGQVIPQVEETYAFIWPAATCNGINEFQVMVTDNTGSCRKEMVQSLKGIVFGELVPMALQRSRTAREAVETMGRLIDRYGYRCFDGPDGEIFSVADPNEGWWMEVTTTGQWVAQRVPDDAFVVIANQFRIGAINPQDSSQFLACANLIDYAKEKGWYDPAQGAFRILPSLRQNIRRVFKA